MPYMLRVDEVSWAATRAVAVKTQPHSVSPTPTAIESGADSGKVTRLTATSAPSTTLASRASARAAVRDACRLTAAARTSSSRPLSSSARVCRPTRNMLISPATIAPNAEACHITWPPMVLSARAGPAIATNAAVARHAAGGLVELRLGRVEPLHADGLAVVEQCRAEGPPQVEPAVPSQERTQERRRCRSRDVGLLLDRDLVAVVTQEQLLERRRSRRQRPDPGVVEQPERSVEPRRCPPRRSRACPGRSTSWTPGRAASPVDGSRELRGDGRAGEVAQLGQRAGLDPPAGPDDAHPVAQALHLGQDVARQQHACHRRRGTARRTPGRPTP